MNISFCHYSHGLTPGNLGVSERATPGADLHCFQLPETTESCGLRACPQRAHGMCLQQARTRNDHTGLCGP